MIAAELGHFSATSVLSINADTPQSWTNPGPETAVVCLATVDTLLSLTGPASAETAFLLTAGVYARMRVDPGAAVSALASATAGVLRLTRAGEA